MMAATAATSSMLRHRKAAGGRDEDMRKVHVRRIVESGGASSKPELPGGEACGLSLLLNRNTPTYDSNCVYNCDNCAMLHENERAHVNVPGNSTIGRSNPQKGDPKGLYGPICAVLYTFHSSYTRISLDIVENQTTYCIGSNPSIPPPPPSA